MGKVHLHKEVVSEGNERVGYAACGQVIYKSHYKTREAADSTQVPENVTCKNCMRTEYFKDHMEQADPIEDVTQEIEETVNFELDTENTMDDWIREHIVGPMNHPDARKYVSWAFLIIVSIGLLLYVL